MEKKIVVNLEELPIHKDYRDYKHRYLFIGRLVKEYIKTYGDQFFSIDNAVGISIIFYEKVKLKNNKTIDINGASLSGLHIHELARDIVKGLEEIAYEKQRQVAELFITKNYASYSKIEIEVYKL
jgi:hypothetical protein